MTNKTLACILATFMVSVGFSTGAVLWSLKREADHYGQLFEMMLTPKIAPPAAHQRPKPRGWTI